MGISEAKLVIDPMAENLPRSTEELVDDHIAIHIGWYAMGGGVFRRATADEVAAYAKVYPAGYAKIRADVERNLAERAAWGQLPAGYELLRSIEKTDAA